MARTSVTYTDLTANTAVADVAGTTLDATNSHTVAKAHPERTILRITNTTSSTKTVTVKAGATNPPGFAGGLGDLVVSLTAGNVTTQVAFVGPLDSSRFLQADGSLSLDVAASMTGTVTAFRVPRSA